MALKISLTYCKEGYADASVHNTNCIYYIKFENKRLHSKVNELAGINSSQAFRFESQLLVEKNKVQNVLNECNDLRSRLAVAVARLQGAAGVPSADIAQQESEWTLTLSTGWVVDGITLRNGHFGGTGGNTNVYQIAAGETIESITGTNVHFQGQLCIGQITITTSTGRVIGPFGSNGNPNGSDRLISHFLENHGKNNQKA